MKEPIIMISKEHNDNISRSSVMFDKLEHEPGDQSYQETCFRRIDGPWSWIMSVLLMTSSLFIYGCASTYGILFPNILKDFKSTRALTAVPGSIALANSGLLGPVIGKLCDHFGSRKILLLGSLVSASGLVASSFVPNIGLLIVTFGIVVGSAICLVYFSTMVAVPMYFDKYKFEATSIVSVGCGSSLLVMTPIVQNLNQALDWRGSMLAMAGFSFIPFAVSLLMRSKTQLETIEQIRENRTCDRNVSSCGLGELVYCSAFKIKIFLLVTTLATVIGTGHSMSLVHLAKFSEDIGIDSYRSSWLYFIIGFSSTASRLLVGKFGKVGPLPLLDIFLLGSVILALGNFVLPSTSVYYALVLYSTVYGVGEGLVYTPTINIAIESVPADKRGSGYGLFQMCVCLAYIIGPILSGFIADVSGSYNNAFYTAGSLEVFAGCLYILSRCIPSSNREVILDGTLDTQLVVVEKETVL